MITPLIQSLVDLGIPLHPIKPGTKAPIAENWQRPSIIYKPTDWPDGCNVGIQVGLPMGTGKDRYGRFRDRYSFILDIDKTDFNAGERSALARLLTGFFKRTDADSSFYRIMERSGGEHQGKHVIGCSHLPFSYKKGIHKTLPVDLYGMTADHDARNVVVTPSVGSKAPYSICDTRDKGYRYSADPDALVNAWSSLLADPISEAVWLNCMRDIGATDEHIFVNAFWPLVFSEDFNYDTFGLVLSAIAVTLEFDVKILAGWCNYLLRHIPGADLNTVAKIHTAIVESPARKKDGEWPGFPRLKRNLEKQIPISRGYDMSIMDNQLRIDRAVNFYCDLVSGLFGGKLKKAEQVSVGTLKKMSDICLSTKTSPPKTGLTYEDLIYPQSVIMMFGSPGSCKTWLGLDLCIGAVTGTDCWGGRFSFREPTPVLYIYGDKSRAQLQQLYISRYVRKAEFPVLYPQNMLDDLKGSGIEPIIVDLSKPVALEFIKISIESTGARIVVVDTLASLLTIKTKDEDVVKGFMQNMRKLATEMNCCFILQHHANKMNAPDLRKAEFTADDFQGSTMFGALCDFTLSVQNGKKDPYAGKVRIGKTGTLSGFDGFDYKIINRKWSDDAGDHHEVSLDLTEPVEQSLFGESLMAQKRLIISALQTPLLKKELREKLRIGTTSEMTPYRFNKNIDEMVTEQLLSTSGTTNNMQYVATPFGLELLTVRANGTEY